VSETEPKRSGPKSHVSGAVSGSRKKAERGAGGRGAVSGLNVLLVAAKACCPLYSLYSALCSLQFTIVAVKHSQYKRVVKYFDYVCMDRVSLCERSETGAERSGPKSHVSRADW